MLTSQSSPVSLADIQYLRDANILKLQSAARMAGLRWKSGAPGYDKNGIVDKLTETPSMLRATVSALRRMESGEPAPSAPNPFADDIAEETKAPTQIVMGADPKALDEIRVRVSALETQLPQTARKADTALTKAQLHDDTIASLTSRIAKLEERAPVNLIIPALPPIELTGSEHKSYKKLLTYLHVNRRVILTGSAGTGKSMAAKNAAAHFGLKFHIQTPVTMSHEYLGHRDAQGVFHETPTFQAYTKGGLLLWDEADAGLPDAMLSANPIFDGNGFAMFGDGNLYEQHPDFLAIFNMNTDGNGSTMQYAGRNRLDGATLARFGVRIHWDIDSDIERAMGLNNDAWLSVIVAIRTLMTSRQIVDVNATPRHTKTGAALLAVGVDRKTVLTDVLKSGALAECWSDVERLPAVQTFLRG